MTRMVSVQDYGRLMADRARWGAYWSAMERVIRPGMTVLDLGSGCGALALIACRLGARRVYVIEPAAADVGRRLALENGFASRIEFIHARSAAVTLPDKADVLVFEPRGPLPFLGAGPASVLDARERHLVPGGAVIPARERIVAAPVQSESAYHDRTRPWRNGFSWRAALQAELNRISEARFDASDLRGEPQTWAELDYVTGHLLEAEGRLGWRVTRPATVHGVVAWLETELAPGLGFSDTPGARTTQIFFPWLEPVPVDPNDTITVDLAARRAGGDYVWTWRTRVTSESGSASADFRQTTLYSAATPPRVARAMLPSFVPSESDDLSMDRFILESIDGQRSVEEIARDLRVRFAGKFGDGAGAIERVRSITMKYAS